MAVMSQCIGGHMPFSTTSAFKYTKLLTLVTYLRVFTAFTFQAEAQVYPHYIHRLYHSHDYKQDGSAGAGDHTDTDVAVPSSDSDSGPSLDRRKHEKAIYRQFALDAFFVDTEYSFYKSGWQNSLLGWAEDPEVLAQFEALKKTRPDLTPFEFYAIDTLGWDGMKCGLDIDGGCMHMPTAVHVRKTWRYHRHHARQTIYALEAISKLHSEIAIYAKALDLAKDSLVSYCGDFARIFFHEETHRKHGLCVQAIANIVIGIITAILIIVTFGIYTAAALGYSIPLAIVGHIGTFMAKLGLYNVNLAVEAATVVLGDTLGIAVPMPLAETAVVLWWESTQAAMRAAWTTGFVFVPPYVRKRSDVPDGQLRKEFGEGTTQIRSDTQQQPKSSSLYLAEWMTREDVTASSSGTDRNIYQQAKIHVQPRFLGTDQDYNATETLDQTYTDATVLRLTKVINICETNATGCNATVEKSNVRFSSSQISSRFKNLDGTRMTMNDVTQLLDSHHYDIEAIFHRLQQPDNKVKSVDTMPSDDASDTLEFTVQVFLGDHLPWNSLLGGTEFMGPTSDGKFMSRDPDVPRLQWRKRHSGGNSRTSKRSNESPHQDMFAMHEVRGMARMLQSFNLAYPQPTSKRDGTEEMNVQQVGDVFTVFLNEQLFRNDIKHESCGTDNYTGDTAQNKAACERMLEDVVRQVKERITKTITESQFSTTAGKDRKRQVSNPLLAAVQPVVQRYSTYSQFHAFDSYAKDPPLLEKSLKESLKNSLVSKAYADQGCYLRCVDPVPDPFMTGVYNFGTTGCQVGCYDPTEGIFEHLYGLDRSKSLEAESPPWNLTEDRIVKASYEAYSHRNPLGFLAGAFSLNPYEKTLKDDTPLLPVCESNHIRVDGSWPCSCGDMYGNETELFLSATDWSGRHKKYEYAIIGECIDQLHHLADRNPAAFMINTCNVVYKGVARPGTGSHQELRNKGHYKENYEACKIYWRFYDDHKGGSDDMLNRDMCKLWSKYSKDWDRGVDHDDKDMSYVNDVLEDRGCNHWKDFWKHDCDKGRRRCDFPAGHRKPTSTDGFSTSPSSSDMREGYIGHRYENEARRLRRGEWNWDWSD